MKKASKLISTLLTVAMVGTLLALSLIHISRLFLSAAIPTRSI